jgi:tight adherence protein C
MALIEVGLGALAAGAILMIVVALTRDTAADRVSARLSQMGGRQVQTLEEIELQEPFLTRGFRPIYRRLSSLGARLTSASFAAAAAKRLALAGYPGDFTVPDWMSAKIIAAVLASVGSALVLLILRMPLPTTVLLGVVAGVVGFLAPDFWLRDRIRERQRAILKALPDSLDLLTISVKAGLGFDAALQRVVEKVQGPLSDEIRRALAEVRVGKPRRDALRGIIPRTEVRPLTTFIGAILQAEQLGVPIARVLQVQSEQLRIERRQRAETSAAKAPVKMLFPLVGCILPALFVVILGPALILISQSLP